MDKRASLLNLLKQYVPTAKELESYKRMIDFVIKNPDCFERSLEIGHITASGFLINKENSRILLTHHKKLDKWLQLGGHCDGDPDVLRVALKEAQEESGILDIIPISAEIFDIDIHRIPEYKGIKAHDHYDVRFLLQVQSDESIKMSDESNDLAWFSYEDRMPEIMDQSILRLFEKWEKYRKFDLRIN